jgi:hypothetical protein
MTPEIEKALREAATAARCIDADLVVTPIFADIIAKVQSETDAPGAIAEMQKAKPKLFKQDDWTELSRDEAGYAEAEKRFRERLSRRSAPPSRSNDFKRLDAALLSETEGHALRRYLGGTRNSYDLSILNAALTRQTGPRDAV